MASKLEIYNQALGLLGERRLASLSEARESRRTLDQFWDVNFRFCLEQGFWKFMKRVVTIDASTTTVPAFGWTHAFTIPDDWVRTIVVSSIENLNPPLLQYAEESGFWFAHCDPLYVAYVSNDPLYGANLGDWMETFAYYVSVRLARLAGPRLSADKSMVAELAAEEKKARINARAKDAMNDPVGFAPQGTWVTSRQVGAMRQDRAPSSGTLT